MLEQSERKSQNPCFLIINNRIEVIKSGTRGQLFQSDVISEFYERKQMDTSLMNSKNNPKVTSTEYCNFFAEALTNKPMQSSSSLSHSQTSKFCAT
jgi:hypothetical protein